MKHRPVLSALLCAGLLGSASLAQASESWSSRAVSTVGHYIAAQGNAALSQIQADLADSISDRIKPILPASSKTESVSPVSGAHQPANKYSASAQ